MQERIEKTRHELKIYTDLDHLKDNAEKQRKELLEKKQHFLETQDALRNELEKVKQEHEKIQVNIDSLLKIYFVV